MKISRLLAACAAAACLMPAVARANAIMICNTGQTAGCVGTLADGVTDPNYSLIEGSVVTGGTKAIAQDGHPIPDYWVANDADSMWIGPSGFDGDSNGPTGTYIYRTTFSLAGLDPSTASLSGLWSSDNDGLGVRINGVIVPQGGLPDSAGYGSLFAFTVGSGFVDGLNTLDFVVTNGDGPTGLRVDSIAGTAASFAAAIPEPASMVLLGSGLLGLYRQRRRTRQ